MKVIEGALHKGGDGMKEDRLGMVNPPGLAVVEDSPEPEENGDGVDAELVEM